MSFVVKTSTHEKIVKLKCRTRWEQKSNSTIFPYFPANQNQNKNMCFQVSKFNFKILSAKKDPHLGGLAISATLKGDSRGGSEPVLRIARPESWLSPVGPRRCGYGCWQGSEEAVGERKAFLPTLIPVAIWSARTAKLPLPP